jgi:hypothetical protein
MYTTVILMGKKLSVETGTVHLLILLIAIGVIGTLAITNTFSFKDSLFNSLYAKPTSQAATYTGEITVGPADTYKTINSAITAAQNGYLVKIHAGTYPEQVEVNKSVTLQAFGDGQVWVDGGNTRNVGIRVSAPNVVVDGLGVKNTLAQGILLGGDQYAGSVKNVTIQNCTIQDFDMTGAQIGDAYRAGVAAYYSGSGMKILNNTIIRRTSGNMDQGTSNGIWFKSRTANQSGGGHLISGNTIKYAHDGIGGEEEDDPHGTFDKDTVVEFNTIDTCWDDGIQVEGGNANIKIRHNDIQRCNIGIATAPNLIGPIYIEYNRITNGRNGIDPTLVSCFKMGDNGVGVAYYTGNTCILTPKVSNGWFQTNEGQNAIVARNNKIHVNGYIVFQTNWTNPTQQTNTSFDNDCLYTADSTRFVKWNNIAPMTFDTWRATYGQEPNGKIDQNCPDPVDPGGDNNPSPTPLVIPTPIVSPTPTLRPTPSPTISPISTPTPVTTGSVIKIYAAGTAADGIYPNMQLILAGRPSKTFNDVRGNPTTRAFNEYTFVVPVPVKISREQVRVAFINDRYTGSGNDRNLVIDKINIDGVDYQSEGPTIYSTGSWNSSLKACSPGRLQSEWLLCNGYLEYR